MGCEIDMTIVECSATASCYATIHVYPSRGGISVGFDSTNKMHMHTPATGETGGGGVCGAA